MAGRISFIDKILGLASAVPNIQKWRFQDANEVKSVINSHATDIENLETSKLASVSVDGTTITGNGTVGNPLVSLSGGGGGSGDMNKSVYDPTNINSSPYDRVNHTGTQSQSTVIDLVTDLSNKENVVPNGATGDYYRGDKSFQTLDKTSVGLNNVDNTSDADKTLVLQPLPVEVSGGKSFSASDGDNGAYYSTHTGDFNYTIQSDFLTSGKSALFIQQATGTFTFVAGVGSTIVQIDSTFESRNIGAHIALTRIGSTIYITGDLI